MYEKCEQLHYGGALGQVAGAESADGRRLPRLQRQVGGVGRAEGQVGAGGLAASVDELAEHGAAAHGADGPGPLQRPGAAGDRAVHAPRPRPGLVLFYISSYLEVVTESSL